VIDHRPHVAKRHDQRGTVVGSRFRYANAEKIRTERRAHVIDRTGLKGFQLDAVDAAGQPPDDTNAHDVRPIPHVL